MFKKILIILSLLVCCLLIYPPVFPSYLWAGCSENSPGIWTPDSHSYADVNACLSDGAFTYDDVIEVPAGDGSVTWSTGLSITKGCHLKGPGLASLTVTVDADPVVSFSPDATSITNGNVFELSGFTFDGNSGSNRALRFGYTSARWPIAKVHDCTFSNFATSALITRMSGLWKGVVYSNTFNAGNAYITRYLNLTQEVEMYSWQNNDGAYDFGTEENLYWEDNTINVTGCMASGGEGRVVFRYNDITLTSAAHPLIDMHGNQTSTNCGIYAGEVYKNSVTHGSNATNVFDLRGGKAVCWGNTMTGAGGVTIRLRNDYCQEDGCGADNDNSPYYVHDTYFFLNYDDGVLEVGSMFSSGCDEEITENSEYWFDNTVWTSGALATGIATGTWANRPTSCTNGVGYWATDKGGNWSSDAGANDGALYVCAGSDFTDPTDLYYTPYAYPHPLREEGVGEVTGTIIPGGCTESEVVAGGKDIVITISGTEWVAAAGSAFDDQRQNIIDGITAATSPANGWNAEWRDKEAVTAVVRTDDYVVTVTMSSQVAISGTFDIAGNQTVTITIPGSAITGTDDPVTATPNFVVSAEVIGGESVSATYDATGPGVAYDASGIVITAP